MSNALKKKKSKLFLDILKNNMLEDEDEMLERENEEEGEEDYVKNTKIPDRPYMEEILNAEEEDDEDRGYSNSKPKRRGKDLDASDRMMLPNFAREEDADDDEEEMKLPKPKRKEMMIVMLGKKMRKNKNGKKDM